MTSDESYSDVTELMFDLKRYGVPVDVACHILERAILIGKRAEKASQDEAQVRILRSGIMVPADQVEAVIGGGGA